MNAKQHRLGQEKHNTTKPEKVGFFSRCKKYCAIAAIAVVSMFTPNMVMAQDAVLTDVDATVEVVHLFDYGSLAMSYLTTTGGVMAILAGVLITLGIGWAFIHRLSSRRGV